MKARLIAAILLATCSMDARAQQAGDHDGEELRTQYQRTIQDCFLAGIVDNSLSGKSTVDGVPTLYFATLNACTDPSNLDEMDAAYRKNMASDPFCDSDTVKERFEIQRRTNRAWLESLDHGKVHRYSDRLRDYLPAAALEVLFKSNPVMPQLLDAIIELHIAIDRECPRSQAGSRWHLVWSSCQMSRSHCI